MNKVECPTDGLFISKSSRLLHLIAGGVAVRTFRVALGSSPVGQKQIEGDGRTPVGEFFICVKNPKSKYTLSLGLSYPNAEAASRGLEAGLIDRAQYDEIVDALRNRKMPPQKTPLGGEIYIHGGGNVSDWTEGCIALSDDDIRLLYDLVDVGCTVVIEE